MAKVKSSVCPGDVWFFIIACGIEIPIRNCRSIVQSSRFAECVVPVGVFQNDFADIVRGEVDAKKRFSHPLFQKGPGRDKDESFQNLRTSTSDSSPVCLFYPRLGNHKPRLTTHEDFLLRHPFHVTSQ